MTSPIRRMSTTVGMAGGSLAERRDVHQRDFRLDGAGCVAMKAFKSGRAHGTAEKCAPFHAGTPHSPIWLAVMLRRWVDKEV